MNSLEMSDASKIELSEKERDEDDEDDEEDEEDFNSAGFWRLSLCHRALISY